MPGPYFNSDLGCETRNCDEQGKIHASLLKKVLSDGYRQCCGSGPFLPDLDPNFSSRIRNRQFITTCI
jgi:hypothetical protein